MEKTKFINKRPILFAAVFFMAGIFIAAALFDNEIAFFVVFGIVFAAAIAFLCLKRKAMFVLLVICLVGISAFSIDFAVSHVEDLYEETFVKGRVSSFSYDERNNTYTYLLKDVEIGGEKSSRNALLKSQRLLETGDMIYCFGEVKSFNYNPFDSFSMTNYKNRVNYTITPKSINILSKNNLNLFEKISKSLRKNIINGMGDRYGQVALSILIGDVSNLDRDIKGDVTIAGLTHVFSVSGLHVAFLAGVIFFLCKALNVNRKLSFVITILSLFVYGFITGFPASMIRASIMLGIMLTAQLGFKRYDKLNSLAFAALLILLISPMSLFELGFQMSVTAMLGIFCFFNPIRKFIYKGKNKALSFVATSVAMSLSANSLLIAIMFNTFSYFGIYFVLSNIVLIPLISIIFVALMLLSPFVLVMPFLAPSFLPIKYLLVAFCEVCTFITTLPNASVKVNEMGIFAIIYIFTMLFMSRYIILNKKYKYQTLIGIIGFSLVLFIVL